MNKVESTCPFLKFLEIRNVDSLLYQAQAQAQAFISNHIKFS